MSDTPRFPRNCQILILYGGHFSLAGTPFAASGHPILLPGNPRDGSAVMVARLEARFVIKDESAPDD